MKSLKTAALSLLVAGLAVGAATPAFAEEPQAAGGPTLQLEARATKSVPEDTAWALFAVESEAKDQAEAQRQAQAALAQVLAVAKKPAGLDVSTERTYTSPVYGKDGKISGWRSHYEIRIESTKLDQVAQTSSELLDKARLQGAGFFLSDAQRAREEADLIQAAVKEFDAKAAVAAKAMGFSGAQYKNIALSQSSAARPGPRPMMYAARAESMARGAVAPEPLAMEPGKAEVFVAVSGTVNLVSQQPGR